MIEEDWLENLREGDKVCYHSHYHGYVIETILKITPTKQIKTKHHTFKNGYHKDSGLFGGTSLLPLTKHIMDEVKRRELISEVKKFGFEKMNLEQIGKVWAVIVDVELALAPPSDSITLTK